MHVNLFDPWTSRFHILFIDRFMKESRQSIIFFFDATFFIQELLVNRLVP